MMDDIDRLYEELTLERVMRPSGTPPIPSGVANPFYYQWYYSHYMHTHAKHKGKKDVLYFNSNEKIHRLSGPAYIAGHFDCEIWFKEGVLHRDKGLPAIKYGQDKMWYVDGDLHRIDGPAVVSLSGPREFWLEGIKFSPKQYKWEISRRKRKGLI
jgi:hypothetical protein